MGEKIKYLSGLKERLAREINQAVATDNLFIARLLGMALLEADQLMATKRAGSAE